MSVFTQSAWIYGHTIDVNNNAINFSELGDPQELLAEIEVGSYSLTDFADAVASAFNSVSSQEYTVTLDRETRKLTISAGNDFELLVTTGQQVAISAWSLMGFSLDKAGDNSYEADFASGSIYLPQFLLQDFIDFEDDQDVSNSKVNKSASGNNIEVISYGKELKMSCNITLATNIVSQVAITSDPQGKDKLRLFMEYASTKAPLEFLENINSFNDFNKCLLNSTPESRDGVGFRLKELYSRGLIGYFETGKLEFLQLS